MPLYEFECDACKKRFERIQKFSDADPEACPACGKGPVKRLLSSPAIQFKGSGFYITDYAKKSTSEAGGKSGSAPSESGTSSSSTTSTSTESSAKPAESTTKTADKKD